MKIVEFIAPVEAIRGNMSGRQDLLYPTNNNKAYEGPVGTVNYARNYTPRFVGAKIAKSGKKYFTVRTKSANHLTAKSKKAMALLGAAGALYAALVKDKTSTLYTNMMAQYIKLQELGSTKTFRQFVMDGFRIGLINHVQQFVFSGPLAPVNIDNPWGKVSGALNLPVAQNIRMKFWTELMSGGVLFTIDGVVGLAIEDDVFENLVNQNYNVLSLTIQESTVRYGGLIVRKSNGTAVDPEEDTISANEEFTTVTE